MLQAGRLRHPTSVHGVDQKPIEGTSMAYSFDDADAPDRHKTQCSETAGSTTEAGPP